MPRTGFFHPAGKRKADKKLWAYNTTSISSYSQQLRQIRYGNNKENDLLLQLNRLSRYELAGIKVIVVKYAGQVMGFAVDEIFGEVQTILKPSGRIYKDAKFFSGATILGDGSIAFVLDIPKMIKHAELKIYDFKIIRCGIDCSLP